MSRPRKPQTSADVELEIRRLMEARARLVADEDQRRGALLREYLECPASDALRAALTPLVGARDAYLFGLDEPRGKRAAEPVHGSRSRTNGAPITTAAGSA